MSVSTRTPGRVRAGIPTGGQFATEARNEPGLTLLDPTGDPGGAKDVLGSLSARAAEFSDASDEEIEILSFAASDSVREVAAQYALDGFVLDRLARDEVPSVRRAAAGNLNTAEAMVEDLTNDYNETVRTEARNALRRRREQREAERFAREPVVGLMRPRAAARALADLNAARSAREADPWSAATHQRLTEAQRIRDFYPEYEDSFHR